MKISAPILDNQLPSFYSGELTIPFNLPSSVGPGDIEKVLYYITDLNGNTKTEVDKEATNFYKDEKNNWYATISIETTGWAYGFYRVRLKFENSDYSNAAVIKYIPEPSVSIANLLEEYNPTSREYTGIYECKDQTEKVVSYCFEIYDLNSNLIVSSGDIFHSVLHNTEPTKSQDLWSPAVGLEIYKLYKIVYKVTTNSGLQLRSLDYTLLNGNGIELPNKNKMQLITTYDTDNGLANIDLKFLDEERYCGQYILLRKSDADGYKFEEELCRFKIDNQDKISIYTDNTLEHGRKYKYCIRRYNEYGIYSEPLESEQIITGDFDDIFLSDKNHQLKIRYNPKVASFKNTVLETKADTIGGKYPVFYRNANVKYKEFSVSGLISVLSDENNLFDFNSFIKEGRRASTPAAVDTPVAAARTQLTSENFDNERGFKLQVLEWLTNGQPKLFRSAAEGTYIVRLMNVSLAPNDTVGRMIHTFTATAYEIASYNSQTMRDNGIIISELLDLRELIKAQYPVVEPHSFLTKPNGKVIKQELHSAPLTTFGFDDSSTEAWQTNENGVYTFSPQEIVEKQMMWKGTDWPLNSYLYQEYYNNAQEDFDKYTNVQYAKVDEGRMLIGETLEHELLKEGTNIIFMPYLSFVKLENAPDIPLRAWINNELCDFGDQNYIVFTNLTNIYSIKIDYTLHAKMFYFTETITKEE